MRTSEQDCLLIALAAASGAADGWSYMGLGHAFVANMTGNTVLIGLAIFTPHDLESPLVSLACYALGAALAAFITRGLGERVIWARGVSWILLPEGALMACAEAGWAAVHVGSTPLQVPVPVVLACVAFAIGLQSGAMLQLHVPGIVTTYITGTWTTLVSGLATLGTREGGKRARERRRFEERLLM